MVLGDLIGDHKMSYELGKETWDKWEYFRYFIGFWEGEGAGQPGSGRSERSYNLVLNDQFIQVNNRSIYPPQEKNPDGDVHEDVGFFSYDKNREKFVLREFHVEGYVNQYIVESWDSDNQIIVMVTEAIENISPGWRARTTYEILDENEFHETFDLSGPGKEWVCYITNKFKRVHQQLDHEFKL